MHFASDNAGPAHPKVMDALIEANSGYAMGYGADRYMDEVRDRMRALLEAPDATVYLTATGTSANVLALASVCQPFQTVFCTPVAHINVDECNAPEFYTGGAKLTLVGEGDVMTPNALRQSIDAEGTRGVHGPARGPVSLSNVTERGNVYTAQQVTDLCSVAHSYDLPVHLDGARFANAVVATESTPAEMSWKAGVDVLVFGGTKNGLMGVEAVIFFNPDHAASFEHRRKRGGHLFSKHRFLSAQMAAYLRDDLWRDLATQANANMARLAKGLQASNQVSFTTGAFPDANMLYFDAPRAVHRHALENGATYYIEAGRIDGSDPDEILTGRLVTDWSQTDQQIDEFIGLISQKQS